MIDIPITTYTSFVFGIVSLLAYKHGQFAIGVLFQVLLATSIFVHATNYMHEVRGKRIFRVIDKLVLYIIISFSSYIALTRNTKLIICRFLYWAGLTYIAYVYHIAGYSHLPHRQWEPWHASVHVVGSISELMLLLSL
jgi:hypothetical protein